MPAKRRRSISDTDGRAVANALAYENVAEDGFYISLEDFRMHFARLYLCRCPTDQFRFNQIVRSFWTVPLNMGLNHAGNPQLAFFGRAGTAFSCQLSISQATQDQHPSFGVALMEAELVM